MPENDLNMTVQTREIDGDRTLRHFVFADPGFEQACAAVGDPAQLAKLLPQAAKLRGPAPVEEGGLWTALHEAAVVGSAESVGLLVKAGADLAGAGANMTPLHQAAKHARLDAIEALANAGAELQAIDLDYQSTPLGWAVWYGKPEAVRKLLELGSKPSPDDFELIARGRSGDLPGSPEAYDTIAGLLEPHR